jgi:hypothetical protein
VRSDAEAQHRIGLGADRLRHLPEVDIVVAQVRMAAQPVQDVVPERREAPPAHPTREVGAEQRGVVVAQPGAEPCQPAHETEPLDRKRHEEEDLPGVVTPDNDSGLGLPADTDVALPGGKPFACLEHGSVGAPLKRAPLRLDRRDVLVNRQNDVGPRKACKDRAIAHPDPGFGGGGSGIEERWRGLWHDQGPWSAMAS